MYFIFELYLSFYLTISRIIIDILFVTWTTIKHADRFLIVARIHIVSTFIHDAFISSSIVRSFSFFILLQNWWIQLLATQLQLLMIVRAIANARTPRHDTRRFVDNILLFHSAEYTRFRTIETRNARSWRYLITDWLTRYTSVRWMYIIRCRISTIIVVCFTEESVSSVVRSDVEPPWFISRNLWWRSSWPFRQGRSNNQRYSPRYCWRWNV